MNTKNVVVVVGRPNVGKSTLFNRLVGRRLSIVHEEPGVTRDRLEVKLKWGNVPLRLLDTGGVELGQNDTIPRGIREQVQEALKEGSVIVLVVDALQGLTPMDEDVAGWVRSSGKNVILAINKVDNSQIEMGAQEFHRLGFSDMVMVSSVHGLGFFELQDRIERHLKACLDETEPSIKVAIVGKPNVGKSTLVNFLFGSQRLIVDSHPGTTRDSIDVDVRIGDRLFTFIDTAGMRRRKQVRMGPETFSVMRALNTIKRTDLVVLVVDVSEGVMAQDVRILNEVRKAGKGCVIAFNKWDLVKKVKKEDFSDFVIKRWKFLEIYPFVYCSALKGAHVNDLIDQVIQVDKNNRREILSEDLDRFLEKALEKKQPPTEEGHMPRFHSIAQVGICPPQFLICVTQPSFVKESYKNFLDREFRSQFPGFEGVALQFRYKRRK